MFQDDDLDMPPPSRRQRSKTSGSTANDRRNVRRPSSSQGMFHIGDSVEKAIDKMSDTIFQAASRPTGPISNHPTVVAAIVKDEGLSDNDMADVCKVLMSKPDVGTLYLALVTPSQRTPFHRVLDNVLLPSTSFFDSFRTILASSILHHSVEHSGYYAQYIRLELPSLRRQVESPVQ